MSLTTDHVWSPRPRSPWLGSTHQTRHRWQLDGVQSLAEAATVLRELAGELTAAHDAGWSLLEPMRSGHLLAARASRRQRARQPVDSSPRAVTTRALVQPRRLRLINEAPWPGDEVFDTAAATRTPVLRWTGQTLTHVSGPTVAAQVLAEVTGQVTQTDLERRSWGLAATQVGRSFDLVADGSALRLHTVHDGALVCSREVLPFQHCADGAATLRHAAASCVELAELADAIAEAGGRLVGSDDGFLHIDYDRSVS